jgi:hypothetical protein
MTTSSRSSSMCRMRALSRTDSGHTHPPPPSLTVPIARSLTPLCVRHIWSGRSSTFGFILNICPNVPSFAPVLSSTMSFMSERGTISSAASGDIPIETARLASGSASMASTFLPSSAKLRARPPARVLLPTPPFPLIASFNRITSIQRDVFDVLLVQDSLVRPLDYT